MERSGWALGEVVTPESWVLSGLRDACAAGASWATLSPTARRLLAPLATHLGAKVLPTTVDLTDVAEGYENRYEVAPRSAALEFVDINLAVDTEPLGVEDLQERFTVLHPELYATEKGDNYYLSRKFLIDVLIPLLGPKVLSHVTAEYRFGAASRADFRIYDGDHELLVELEGAGKYLEQGTLVREVSRSREVMDRRVLRIASVELQTDVALDATRDALRDDPTLRALVDTDWSPAEGSVNALFRGCVRYLLGISGAARELTIRVKSPEDCAWLAAAFDVVEGLWAAHVGFGTPAWRTGLVVEVSEGAVEQVGALRAALAHIVESWPGQAWTAESENWNDGWRLRASCSDARRSGDAGGVQELGFSSAGTKTSAPPDSVVHVWRCSPAPPTLADSRLGRPQVHESDDLPSTLDLLFRRHMGLAALRESQLKVVRGVLDGRSQLVIMPTAGGKSACYQFVALLSPGITFVVTPLRTLLRDQLKGLQERGVVASLGLSGASGDQRALVQRLQLGHHRIVYLTPERLLRDTFRQELNTLAALRPLAQLVIDEVHVASEWGHDFRPSYLGLIDFLERYRQAMVAREERRPPVLCGYTATASKLVRRDLCRMLNLNPDRDVVEVAAPYRRELSFSVAQLDALDARHPSLTHSLVVESAHALGQESEHVAQRPAIVFCPYSARSNGKSTRQLGVIRVADFMRRTVPHFEHEDVRVSSSQSPLLCPKSDCMTPLPTSVWGRVSGCARCNRAFEPGHANCPECGASTRDEKKSFRCDACGCWHLRPKPVSGDDWSRMQVRAQEAFMGGKAPLMVATKGFGMGVDKADIRTVVHASLTSGVSAYYQEAGRAGRDGQRSHVVLTLHPLAPRCKREWFDERPWERLDGHAKDWRERAQQALPPCARRDSKWRCPVDSGLGGLCDLGHQAKMLSFGFGDPDEEIRGVDDLAGTLWDASHRVDRPSEDVALSWRSAEEVRDGTESGLFLLKKLGLVKTFVNEYQAPRGASRPGRGGRGGMRRRWHATVDSDWVPAPTSEARAKLLAAGVARPTTLHEAGFSSVQHAAQYWAISAIWRRYSAILQMRLRDLTQLYSYAADEPMDGECRQARLLRELTECDIPDAWRCERCDWCRPELDFPDEVPPFDGVSASSSVMTRKIAEVLDGGATMDDLAAACAAVLQEAHERQYLRLVHGRASARLSGDPGNLVALLLRAAVGFALNRRPKERDIFAEVFIRVAVAQEWWDGLDVLQRFVEICDSTNADVVRVLMLATLVRRELTDKGENDG